jgi:uncharacterized protein YqeY
VVDKTLVLRKLAELEEYLEQIKEYANVSAEQYSREWRTQRIVERFKEALPAEIKILESYMPASASDEEIEAALSAALAETVGATARDFGK